MIATQQHTSTTYLYDRTIGLVRAVATDMVFIYVYNSILCSCI